MKAVVMATNQLTVGEVEGEGSVEGATGGVDNQLDLMAN